MKTLWSSTGQKFANQHEWSYGRCEKPRVLGDSSESHRTANDAPAKRHRTFENPPLKMRNLRSIVELNATIPADTGAASTACFAPRAANAAIGRIRRRPLFLRKS
jgi:hypothetical protein